MFMEITDTFRPLLRSIAQHAELQMHLTANPVWLRDWPAAREVVDWFVDVQVQVRAEALPGPGRRLNVERSVPAPGEEGQVFLFPFTASGVRVGTDQIGGLMDPLDEKGEETSEFIRLGQSLRQYREEGQGPPERFVAGDPNQLVIIERAVLAPGLRGQGGLGRYLLDEVLRLLSGGSPRVLEALQPYPWTVKDPTEAEVQAMRRTVESMDFERFSEEVWVRPTVHEHPQSARRREAFRQL